MTRLTYAQLEGLWINAGGSKATAPMAAAIAEAESGGDPAQTSRNPDGGTNVGLWQLDTPGGVGAGHSVADLKDPFLNAALAVNGSKNGTNWASWETFANGAYKAFLSGSTTPDTASVPDGTLAGGTATGTGGGTATATGAGTPCLLAWPSVSLAVTSVGGGCIITKSAARAIVGGLLLGSAGILGIAALIILASSAFDQTGAGRAVVQAGETIAPAARVVRAVTPAARRERGLQRRESTVGQRERVRRLERREQRNPAA